MQKVIFMQQLQEYSDYMERSVIEYIADGQIETYESYKTYDILAFDWYDLRQNSARPTQILIYIDKDDLFYICEDERAYRVAAAMFTEDPVNETAMYIFFKKLLRGSIKQLEELEDRVSALDDDVSDGTEDGLRERLIVMRNEIMRAKKYYEQFSYLFEELCVNENGLLSDDCIKLFKILGNRSVRLMSQTANLQESIVQVRESYQAQIGIEQNDLVKTFTLVTSIFLPLTLIAGWYGMNLKMPEFGWKYGYLFVAGLCLAVCVAWVIIFKKKKWFR